MIFCFVVSSFFTITAKEVYGKSLKFSGEGQLSKFGNYIIEYVNDDNINTIVNILSLLKA
jgi:uncharacterized protein YlbG (UPF0298 family)